MGGDPYWSDIVNEFENEGQSDRLWFGTPKDNMRHSSAKQI